eukprot:CAMPEP_0116574262 /NCGR_PEP_ID=MMETSP0397-20121206/19292_1 /TAXON_ID=216820 /ORGANISM="Cyclophora tenuis, Strain ECT3854" /LENGTH=173 /DNA_ID=CAMNT_0004102999 /DNA_START=246 /DNA_END=763 /DNA_ORIENTATION=+
MRRQWNCNVRLRGKDFGDKENMENVVLLETRDNMEEITDEIEDIVASSVSKDEVPRMMYELARSNDHHEKSELGVVNQRPRPSVAKTWLRVVSLPCYFEEIAGLFIGKGGAGIQIIHDNANPSGSSLGECSIDVYRPSYPYVLVTGTDPHAVAKYVDAVRRQLSRAESRASKR